ncbi:MAG TPA: response regulator transcription factor, partial [Verrucomicrobiota bacterium]|nr:response regulator transcription factor [Verrucomicrobiota bacterium]
GAAGYMTKESAPEELVGAIKKVLAGGRYVSPSLAEKLATYVSGDSKPPQEKLSDREFQVLRLIASGKMVSEIAKELSLSVKTISTYRSRILEKMGIKNNAELMHYAIQHELVE